MTDRVLSQKHETQVQELSPDQLDHVTGGAASGGILVAMGDGSVRLGDANGDGDVDGRDFLVWRKSGG